MTNKHLILVGAGHAHLHLLKNSLLLQKSSIKITLISPTDFYYNGLAPGVLSKHYPKNIGEISIKCHLDTVNGQYIQEKVVGINIDEKTVTLTNSDTISYDYISFNIGAKGSELLKDNDPRLYPTRPVTKLWSFQKNLEKIVESDPETIRVAIVGGGAAGVELAGNVHRFIEATNIKPVVILISRGNRLLPQFPRSVGSKVIKSFQKRNIQIILNSEVIRVNERGLVLINEDEISFDIGISAIGIDPNTVDSKNELKITSKGEIIVNKYLQCKNHSNIFATGDCICFESHPLWKSGYHAINQGSILLHNILAIKEDSKLRPYKPKRLILTGLNLGDGTGLVIVGRFTYQGKVAFKIKEFVEKRFMRNHQC